MSALRGHSLADPPDAYRIARLGCIALAQARALWPWSIRVEAAELLGPLASCVRELPRSVDGCETAS